MSIIKNNKQVRICINFRKLNLSTPKDEYVMPITNMLIDATSSYRILTFMDGYLGYNQIFITESNVHKIAFKCLRALGVFEWIVMPFGSKNT